MENTSANFIERCSVDITMNSVSLVSTVSSSDKMRNWMSKVLRFYTGNIKLSGIVSLPIFVTEK